MNFSFEGNYKSKRNINLGGTKTQSDKKTLLAKAQSERKAREQERLRWKSALKIQSFYRGRQIASAVHQQGRLLLEQQLKKLSTIIEKPFDSPTTASVNVSSLLVSCIRQLLVLCHSPTATLLHSTFIAHLSSIMSADIVIHGDDSKYETYSVIQLLLLNDQHDMDSKIWLLVLLAGRLFSLELENDAWTGHSVSILKCLRCLMDPTTYSILQNNHQSSTLEPRGIYLRFMTHLLLKDHILHYLHILMCQQLAAEHESGTMQSGDIFRLVIEIATLCLDNLHPPFEYSPSRIVDLRPPSVKPVSVFNDFSATTSASQHSPSAPLILTRTRVLDLLISEIISVPGLLDSNRGSEAGAFVNRLPFDELLQTILLHFQDGDDKEKWTMEPDVVAGLLINLMVIGNQQVNAHLEHSLITYCFVYQTLLHNLPPQYLPDTNKKQTQTRIILDSESDDSDTDDGNTASMHRGMEEFIPDTTNYNTYIKAQLEGLLSSDRLDALLHQFLDLTFELYMEQGIGSPTSLAVIRSVASLFLTFIIRWPTKKDHILNTLLYHHRRMGQRSDVSFLQILWQGWLYGGGRLSVFDESEGRRIMDELQEAVKMITDSAIPECWSVLYLLCEMYTRLLLTIGDDEFFNKSAGYNQLKLDDVVTLSGYLKNISFVLFWRANVLDVNLTLKGTGIQVGQLRNAITTLLQQIHMRDSRRTFCPKGHWFIYGLDTESFSSAVVAEEYALENGDTLASTSSSNPSAFDQHRLQHTKNTMSKARLAMVSPRLGLLNNIPFVISFEHRVQIFRMLVMNDRKYDNGLDFVRPHAEARIRRDHVFEDGFNQLYKLGPDLKKKIAIMFIDSFGMEESGIDGGGVFKEFLTSLGHEAFNTDYGLFSSTSDQLLYPNPSSFATEASQLAYFEFLGLIIGKALYEGILLDVAFAEFFLKKCLGKVNYLDDLPSLDLELYKGLIQVKNFDGNVEDLCLDFTLTENGNQSKTIDLIPNGSKIAVTNQNRIQYVYRVANYRLNIQIAKQCKAFFSGLSTIVDIKWLRMFNQQELQIMLGGASVPIDIRDLRQHTVYADFQENDLTIQFMWQALSSFTNEERMKFVKFVTSCSRPPVLGFKELQPQLCIRRAGTDESRLPTSSTCVNLLKLPAFSTYHGLREKLLYAINADAGFDLS